MINTQGTTAAPIGASPSTEPFDRARFSDGRDEAAYAKVRQQLELRPTHYLAGGEESGTHPDRRPCPSWCWVGQCSDEYDHEVNPDHPLEADHTLEEIPHVVASLYQGNPSRGSERVVSAATLEPRLEQVGQGDPQVRVAFRRYKGRESKFVHDFLRLSLEDARELALALNYLVDLAE